jgi:hypothetical protein
MGNKGLYFFALLVVLGLSLSVNLMLINIMKNGLPSSAGTVYHFEQGTVLRFNTPQGMVSYEYTGNQIWIPKGVIK